MSHTSFPESLSKTDLHNNRVKLTSLQKKNKLELTWNALNILLPGFPMVAVCQNLHWQILSSAWLLLIGKLYGYNANLSILCTYKVWARKSCKMINIFSVYFWAINSKPSCNLLLFPQSPKPITLKSICVNLSSLMNWITRIWRR